MTKEIERAIKAVEKCEDEVAKYELKFMEIDELLKNARQALVFAQKELAMLLISEKAGTESFATFARRMEGNTDAEN
ncbi:MAG: hypothetical protein Q4C42_11905 [Clostridia bacterium]|nr:hypothetical protein [Clostridia bacterium]